MLNNVVSSKLVLEIQEEFIEELQLNLSGFNKLKVSLVHSNLTELLKTIKIFMILRPNRNIFNHLF